MKIIPTRFVANVRPPTIFPAREPPEQEKAKAGREDQERTIRSPRKGLGGGVVVVVRAVPERRAGLVVAPIELALLGRLGQHRPNQAGSQGHAAAANEYGKRREVLATDHG